VIESDVKAPLVKTMKLMLGGVTFRLEDKFTSGYPDIAHTSQHVTTWIEVKHVTPLKPFKDADRRALQNFKARELQRHGHCWYVFYIQTHDGFYTAIKTPEEVYSHGADIILSTVVTGGYDHVFVCEFLRKQIAEYKTRWS
jgi:hypothetical protein